MRLRVLDLDGALVDQPCLAGLIAAGEAERVDARDLEQRLRILASRRAFRALGERLGEGAAGTDTQVLFYGSGDFHHLTALFVALHPEPLAVVHFDNHPDWVRYPTINCGSWVNMALRSPHVAKVVTVGPCSDDLQNPEWKLANLAAMREGRLAVYPWRSEPTRLWGAPVTTPSTTTDGGRLTWRNLADESWSDFLDELADSLPAPAIWITIDKDVLGHGEAVTNWDQGEMTLDHVIAAVRRLASSFRIVGIDVCGDYSRPQLKDPLRAFLSWSDHPEPPPHGRDDLAVNDRSNARLLGAFREVLQ
jgi:arginase family enzyme